MHKPEMLDPEPMEKVTFQSGSEGLPELLRMMAAWLEKRHYLDYPCEVVHWYNDEFDFHGFDLYFDGNVPPEDGAS